MNSIRNEGCARKPSFYTRFVTLPITVLVFACGVLAFGWAFRNTRPASRVVLAASPAKKPNIVFILTDDMAMNLVQYMPYVQAMQREGTTFSNYFVTDSLCCPSRSSIFTGKFPHNTGVFTNSEPDGGYDQFNAHGNEAQTFAVALQKNGYKTAMLGKYLNGYHPAQNGVPKGWNEWDVAGDGYPEFNYALNQNGHVQRYGHDTDDYLTDVVARLGEAFVRKSAGHPYFIEIATFAPHAPYIPAPRDANKFPNLKAPRTRAYAARPDSSAPNWLKGIAPLRPREMEKIDEEFRMRAQSVQAIDKMIGEIRAMLAASGDDNNTFVFFSSDNGLHMGEYSMRPGKMTPFDTDIHVPLVAVGPGVAKGHVANEIVGNVDLCATFTELAETPTPGSSDGHSLVALLRGGPAAEWRGAALIEHHHPGQDASDPDAPVPHGGNPPTYAALRLEGAMYVEYQGDETGYYDLGRDPDELHNVAKKLPEAKRRQLHDMLRANQSCKGAESCWAAGRIVP